jgi:hypothetical protein
MNEFAAARTSQDPPPVSKRQTPTHRHNTRSTHLHDSRIDFSCDSPAKWSEPCFIKTSGSETFPARVCVRAGTQIMADVKLYVTLKDGIQGLFKRFTEDLVQQKTPKLKDSSQFSAVLLDVLQTDYTEQKQGVVPRNVAGNRPRRVEPFYFLLVERLDGQSPNIFAAGYIFSQAYGDLLYIRHLASEVEQSNMGGALMAVAMNAARDCGHTTAILNFNPRKAYLQKVYERMGFANAKHKRMFVDEEGDTLFDRVHSWGMLKELKHPIGSVRVGLMHAFASSAALATAATRESSPYLVAT